MRRRTALTGLGAVGLVAIVSGSFLPWLRSGATTRNSYQAGAQLHQLGDLHGPLNTAYVVWPAVSLTAAVVIVLFCLGRRRGAAGLGLLLGAAAAVVAVLTLRLRADGLVRPEPHGPAVTLCGAALLIVASSVLLPRARRTPRS